MPDIFISYSHKDSEYAHQLAQTLRRQGLDVWIDDRIDYGEHWPRVIQENLTNCRLFVVVMSTNAFNSMWVQNEVSFAQESNKPIFPLLLEGRVWLSLASMQYVDVRNGVMPPAKFAERLKRALGQPFTSTPPEPTHATRQIRRSQTNLLLWTFGAGLFLLIAVFGVLVLYALLRPGGMLSPGPSVTPETLPVVFTEATVTDTPPPFLTDLPVIDKPLPEPPTKPPVTDVYPPDPQGPQYIGMWFAAGTCIDLDAIDTPAGNGSCDLQLQPSAAMLDPINGAQITGQATSKPPSLNTCRSVELRTSTVAIQTEAYLCFLTNAGRYGFFVARKDLLQKGVTYDAYIFP